jgi:hypothetical protein
LTSSWAEAAPAHADAAGRLRVSLKLEICPAVAACGEFRRGRTLPLPAYCLRMMESDNPLMTFTPVISRRAVLPLLCLMGLLPAACGAASPSLTPAAAQSSPEPPIQYTIRFPAPHTHYAEVEAFIPAAPGPDAEVFMAVWTPGSYLVREYARHVEEFRAFSLTGARCPSQSLARTAGASLQVRRSLQLSGCNIASTAGHCRCRNRSSSRISRC